jgi:hypothetical protein
MSRDFAHPGDEEIFGAILKRHEIPNDSFVATEIWVEFVTASTRDEAVVAAEESAAEYRQKWLDYKAGKRRDWFS